MVLKSSGIRHVYLILFFLSHCSPERPEPVTIVWKDNKAVALSISRKVLDAADDSISYYLRVHLASQNSPAVLGEYSIENDAILFEPLVPLTRGLVYEVRFKNIILATQSVPGRRKDEAPVVSAVFPSQDTLPQNVLKFYFQFSNSMQEGQALKHIHLLKESKDTAKQVFLDLQPELWNSERTLLTLWLDPGRIKRDLQPNKQLGEPLKQNVNYELVIDTTWRDIYGSALRAVYTKKFFVSDKDNASPDPEQWNLEIPDAGSTRPLQIKFPEPLDHALASSSISVTDETSNPVYGSLVTKDEETVLLFLPSDTWSQGNYKLIIEGRLEDLAGNNLNRPFDYDNQRTSLKTPQEVFIRTFTIR